MKKTIRVDRTAVVRNDVDEAARRELRCNMLRSVLSTAEGSRLQGSAVCGKMSP